MTIASLKSRLVAQDVKLLKQWCNRLADEKRMPKVLIRNDWAADSRMRQGGAFHARHLTAEPTIEQDMQHGEYMVEFVRK